MSYRDCTIVPRFVWVDGKMEQNLGITVDSNGVITNIGKISEKTVYLKDKILLPGFVNSHSHAFHRHLRGRSEIGGKGAETFWKWRDNMYSLVDGIDENKLYEFCTSTFREMLSSGITTVGEFHYVHHGEGRFDVDKAVLKAAKEAGIRITLIQTLYERAGFEGGPLHPVQQRFVSKYDEFIENLENLLTEAGPTVTIAVAAHSTRAVHFENIQKLYDFAVKRGLAFHIHLEEQPKEIIDCKTHLKCDMSPSDVLLSKLELGPQFTAVHSTYTSVENMGRFAQKGVNVSICPCTEGYLGDGIPHVNPQLPISFGTDCNNRICFLEEMRWACYTQQMKCNSRSVAGLSASRLLEAATAGGARSLAISNLVGSFEVGKQFDAVVFNLATPLLRGLDANSVLDGIVFGCGNREIDDVIVAGDSKMPENY